MCADGIPEKNIFEDCCTWKLCWKTITYVFGNRLVDCFSSLKSFGKGTRKSFGKMLSRCYDFRKSALHISGVRFPNVSVQEEFCTSSAQSGAEIPDCPQVNKHFA